MTIHVSENITVTIGLDGVTTEGWTPASALETEEDPTGEHAAYAMVHGMESTLLALYKAGIIQENDPRLRDAIVTIFDALDNHS